jgi:hypothetical protein
MRSYILSFCIEPSAADVYQDINYKLSNLVWHKCQFPPLLTASVKEIKAGTCLPAIISRKS